MSERTYNLISVVIPTHNRCARLERAIQSVLQQAWPAIEIIVIDDASTDGTAELLLQLKKTIPNFQYLRNEKSQGGGGARNQGIACARGDFVAFLDDDDIWLPFKLECQMALLQLSPLASAASCCFTIEHESGRKELRKLLAPNGLQEILASNHLGGASMCLARKSMLELIGGFDPKLRSGQDWDLWIKLYLAGPIVVCDESLVGYILHSGIRITSNYDSAYQGRRRIYFRYKSDMTLTTKNLLLCELIFCRNILRKKRTALHWCDLLPIVRLAPWFSGLRYIFRFMKYKII